jgi:hypothetical protein
VDFNIFRGAKDDDFRAVFDSLPGAAVCDMLFTPAKTKFLA